MFAVLPTMLTLGNAVCGFGAITFAAKVDLATRTGWGTTNTECLYISAVLIFLAMVFDMLDGQAARWANQTSEFGAQLDSLCDAISFGAAPAMILVKFCGDFHPRLLWAIAILFVLCAILRLARFNVETGEEDSHKTFSGLPSPAAAGTVASFMLVYPDLEYLAKPLAEGAGIWQRSTHSIAAHLLPAMEYLLPVIALSCACLMVSRVRYSHVFNQWFRGRRSYQHIVQLLIGGVILYMVQEMLILLIFCLFSFGNPLRAGWRTLLGRPDALPPALADVSESPPDDFPGENQAS